MICIPTGSPAFVRPMGTTTDGKSARFTVISHQEISNAVRASPFTMTKRSVMSAVGLCSKVGTLHAGASSTS